MNYCEGIDSYEYFIFYRFLKEISNKDPITLLFFLNVVLGLESENSINISHNISNGKSIYKYIKYLL
jgi:hypothetical protein